MPSHLWPRLFWVSNLLRADKTQHLDFNSRRKAHLKLFNAPGPQWDQIEELFLWVECKWIRNMWIKFLLNLEGNLNIKGTCFSNYFLTSAKVRTLEKRVGDIHWIQMYPAFSSLVRKEHFDLWRKGGYNQKFTSFISNNA